jgi:hypothetical protein
MRHRAGFSSADPRRARRSACLAVVLVAALACGCSGGKGDEVTQVGPSCSTPPASPDQPAARLVADARRAAVTYVRLIARHHYDSAEAAILPCSPAEKRSLLGLWKFMAGMPVGGARVNADTTRINRQDATATAQLSIFVRFGHDPASVWVKAATRSLKLQLHGERWLVAADVTRAAGGDLAAYGFSSFSRPVFYDGSRATVVASAGADDAEARFILRVADAAVPEIWSRLGDGKAARRPLIFLVESKRQGERLAHIDLGKVRTPAGWQYSAFTYVDMPEWEQLDEDSQQSMVVHELTHVATRSWLSGAPHSLVEGVAMYEEDRWRRDHRIWPISYDRLGDFYAGVDSIQLWQRRWSDWGLRNLLGIHYAYLDAMAMVQTIVDRHGGVDALRRLAAALPRRGVSQGSSQNDIRAAFLSALGVSFEQVVSETRNRLR